MYKEIDDIVLEGYKKGITNKWETLSLLKDLKANYTLESILYEKKKEEEDEEEKLKQQRLEEEEAKKKAFLRKLKIGILSFFGIVVTSAGIYAGTKYLKKYFSEEEKAARELGKLNGKAYSQAEEATKNEYIKIEKDYMKCIKDLEREEEEDSKKIAKLLADPNITEDACQKIKDDFEKRRKQRDMRFENIVADRQDKREKAFVKNKKIASEMIMADRRNENRRKTAEKVRNAKNPEDLSNILGNYKKTSSTDTLIGNMLRRFNNKKS